MSKKSTNIEFIEKSIQIHGYLYDYSLVEYIDNKTKVKIICKKHGLFYQRPDSHLRGCGCAICGEQKFKVTQSKTTDKFIEESKIIHGDIYDYSLVKYVNAFTKVKIICRKHNIFNICPNSHLRKIGCPICKESKGEKAIRLELENNNINFERQKTFENCKYISKLKFDFYLNDYNICIEFDGKQHFDVFERFGGDIALQNQKIKDKIKTEFCINNNITLFRIKYNECVKSSILSIIKNITLDN